MPINEKLILEIRADVANLKRGIAQSKQQMNGFKNQLQGVGSMLKLVFVGVATAAFYKATKGAMDFSKSMTKIKALVGIAGDEVDNMGKIAKQMAIATGQSANDAAEALYFITSAGLRGAEAMEVLEASLKASAIGLGETKTIADLATSALNAYGSANLSATEATDVMVAAVREGKLEASELAASMGRVLPLASAMGVEFHEVGAAFAALSRTGTNAAEASTQIRGIFTSLLKPTADAKKQLGLFGMSAEGLRKNLREKGLLNTLEILKEKFEGNDDAAAKVFGNVRALSAVLDLLGPNAEGTGEIFKALTKTLNATGEAFATSMEDPAKRIEAAMERINIRMQDVMLKALPFLANWLEKDKVLAILFGNSIEKVNTKLEKYKLQLKKVNKFLEENENATDEVKSINSDLIKVYEELIKTETEYANASEEGGINLTPLINKRNELLEEELRIKGLLLLEQEKLNDEGEDEKKIVEEKSEAYDAYKLKLEKLGNTAKILGDDFDFTTAKIDLMQQALIGMLDASEGSLTLFKNLNKELKILEATDIQTKMGIEADTQGDIEMDEWMPDADLQKLFDTTKAWKDWRTELENINKESDARLAEQTDAFFANNLAKRQEAFAQYSMQLQAIGQMFAEGMGTMTDSLVDSFGLADTGVQALVKSMLKMLARFAAQQLIQSIITKLLSKVDIGVKQGVANASAITAATNMAAGMGPYGLIALPGLIGYATGMVNTAFAGVQAFAEGGIVTSPMMGLVGEAGSEAIIPLDRLNNIVAPTSGEFTLRGQDLVLALSRADNFKDRILN